MPGGGREAGGFLHVYGVWYAGGKFRNLPLPLIEDMKGVVPVQYMGTLLRRYS